jgi:hypothetical protein
MPVEYKLFDVVRAGVNLMASRTPRVQKDVPREFGDHLSWMLNNDMWNVNPATGDPLSYEGKSLQEVAEAWLSMRPHALEPVPPVDTSGECWTSGNITMQGQRLKELTAFCGSEKAALVLLKEEAESYGVRPFTTEKSSGKVDPKEKKKNGVRGDGRQNPWDKEHFQGSEEYRLERLESILKTSAKMASEMAANAHVRLDGGKLLR